MQCHKCEYNGKGSNACLSCVYTDISYKNLVHVNFLENIEDNKLEETNRCTNLSIEDEDKLRTALCELFSLSQLELLMLQAIINEKTLTQFAQSIEKFSMKNTECSREHAFQIRKGIAKKLPHFKDVLLTNGQRKQLKTE